MDIPRRVCKATEMHRSLPILQAVFALVALVLPSQASETLLTKDGLQELNAGMWAAVGISMPEPDADLPVIGPDNTQDGVRLLRILSVQKDINGFQNVLYDNRDRAHSLLPPELYPSLTHLKYGPQMKAEALDSGLAGRIILPAVVLGNSSTAVTGGPAPRSLPRLAMTNSSWRQVTPFLYVNNHIYVYPEHRDHDEADRFPINWPYMVVSQGSSRSDLPFLNAIAMTLAAFPSDTFAFLRENGLIAPTLQMILRRNLSSVLTREDYLTGAAHPPVFEGKMLQAGRMVGQASKLRPEDAPPLVQLNVVEENFSDAAGLAGLSERFLDTPAAIGRTWRGYGWQREMVVSAKATVDPNKRPLTYEWRLLRGDPDLVSIEPLDPAGETVRIRIAWHEPWIEQIFQAKPGKTRMLSRLDIGVFANNGVHDSAPSMISIDFPEHQIREYADGPDDTKRLVSINYDAKGRGVYFDPLLFWTADWTDTARYDEDGVTLLGWDRQTSEGVNYGFVAHDPTNQLIRHELDLRTPRFPTLTTRTE